MSSRPAIDTHAAFGLRFGHEIGPSIHLSFSGFDALFGFNFQGQHITTRLMYLAPKLVRGYLGMQHGHRFRLFLAKIRAQKS